MIGAALHASHREPEAMSDAVIAGRAPIPVDVEAGKTYYWCTCGRSQKQPFCDGSHKGSEFSPQAYTPDQPGRLWFCACKRSGKAPLCDGSHKQLG
jgi:CDGSH-type Zn-finger protein